MFSFQPTRSIKSVQSIMSRVVVNKLAIAGTLGLLSLVCGEPALAEGTAQWGLNQPLLEFGNVPINTTETRISSASRALYVDVVSAGEVINISACGNTNNSVISMQIFETIPNAVDPAFTPTTATSVANRTFDNNIDCNDTLTADRPLAGASAPQQFIAPAPGKYEIRLSTNDGTLLRRVDVTVTPTAATPVDPTEQGGRLHAYVYAYNAGSFSEAAATDTDYYVKVPGGRPGENYVWQLDLNNFAGFVYDIVGNAYGVEAPNSGFSVDQAGNNVTPEYPVYVSYPAEVGPLPTAPPNVSNFRFVDNAGVDNTISPNGTVGVQDSGEFSFTTDVIGTYSIQIDVNQDGVFSPEDTSGNASGDVFLNGITNGPTTVTAPWNGRSNTGDPLPEGIYDAQVQMRIGEYHFIAGDAETSGGPGQDGLTVYQAFSQTNIQDTLVFWDDKTFLGGTTTLPNGAFSSTPAGKHNWGTFSGDGFGNLRFIDTYVYGATTLVTTPVIIIDSDDPNASDPRILLVKRITAINRGLANEQLFDGSYVNVGTTSDDDNEVNWPGPVTTANAGSSSGEPVESYITGIAGINDASAVENVTLVPGDELEYTIPFLSNGFIPAEDLLICDRIPVNTKFLEKAYNTNNPPFSPPFGPGGDRGISLSFNGTTTFLTNMNDGDEIADSGGNDNGIGGYYFGPGIDPAATLPGIDCGGPNTNGAVVVDMSDVPNATGDGTPSDSYGFIRFRVTIE